MALLTVWSTAHTYAGILGFSFFNGFVQGGLVSLFPVVIAEVFGVEKLPFLFSILNVPNLIGNFLGAPLSGGKEMDGNSKLPLDDKFSHADTFTT